MTFSLPFTSGSKYDSVGGKCMVPNTNPMRRWLHRDTNYQCASGCTSGGESSPTVYIPPIDGVSWTGTSGAVLIMYATNTSHDVNSISYEIEPSIPAVPIVYYFNSYDDGQPTWNEPQNMVDGEESIAATTETDADNQTLNGNTNSFEGDIVKVELGVWAWVEGYSDPVNIHLQPILDGTPGSDYYIPLGETPVLGEDDWVDITAEVSPWHSGDIDTLDCLVTIEFTGKTSVTSCAIVFIRVTGTDTPPVMKIQQESKLACNAWDVYNEDWYGVGEYVLPRGISGGAGTYVTTHDDNRFDVGDGWQTPSPTYKPLVEDHCYIDITIDESNYIWGAWGGHAGIGTGYGRCYIQCFKSTKPVTDPTWSPSGSGMWINKGTITTSDTAAYIKLITGRCSCHNNWYFVGFRDGGTSNDWKIYYSQNSGTTWNIGISFASLCVGGNHTYSGFNFQYDSNSDKTLLFVRPYPAWTAYTNPGYGIYWTDCHRMSGGSNLPSNRGGFFATNVDPQNITTTSVPTYSGANIPPSPNDGELKDFDRYDPTSYPSWVYLDQPTRKIFFISHFISTNSYYTDNLRICWKTIGTNDYFKSTSVWTQTGTETVSVVLPSIHEVRSSDGNRYIITPVEIHNTNDKHNYAYFLVGDDTLSPILSSQTNWQLMKSCTVASSSIGSPKWFDVSNDYKFVSVFYAYSSNVHPGGIVNGSTRQESFLTYWNNIDFNLQPPVQPYNPWTYGSIATNRYGENTFKRYLDMIYGPRGSLYLGGEN